MTNTAHEAVIIQGLSCAGKTTAATILAERRGYGYRNTGKVFRGVAAAIIEKRIAAPDAPYFVAESGLAVDTANPRRPLVAVGGYDVSDILERPDVALLATWFGSQGLSSVIEKAFDRTLTGPRIVVEGKNISEDRIEADRTYSVLLYATQRERARRKFQQAQEQGKLAYSERQAIYEITLADQRDSQLIAVRENTCVIDTTHLSPFEVVERIQSHIDKVDTYWYKGVYELRG